LYLYALDTGIEEYLITLTAHQNQMMKSTPPLQNNKPYNIILIQSVPMKKKIFFTAILLQSLNLFSQVGINTTTPRTTFDVSAKNTDGSSPEGLLPPRLTGDQLKAADGMYTANQKGAIVYITESVNTSSVKTTNVNTEGYYYFDGNTWQKIVRTYTAANGLNSVGNSMLLGGTLSQNTSIANNGNSLQISGSGISTTFDSAGNVGIGVSSPTESLDILNTLRVRNIPSSGGTVMITADNDGVIRKQALPTGSAPTVIANLSANGVSLTSANWANFNYTGTSITLPANSKYIVSTTQLITGATSSTIMPSGQSIWIRSTFSDSSTTYSASPDIQGSKYMSGAWGPSIKFGLVSGNIILRNNTASAKTYYYWVGQVENNNYAGTINNFGGAYWQENQMYAIPIN
jgi:hypothetical protein